MLRHERPHPPARRRVRRDQGAAAGGPQGAGLPQARVPGRGVRARAQADAAAGKAWHARLVCSRSYHRVWWALHGWGISNGWRLRRVHEAAEAETNDWYHYPSGRVYYTSLRKHMKELVQSTRRRSRSSTVSCAWYVMSCCHPAPFGRRGSAGGGVTDRYMIGVPHTGHCAAKG